MILGMPALSPAADLPTIAFGDETAKARLEILNWMGARMILSHMLAREKLSNYLLLAQLCQTSGQNKKFTLYIG